MAKKILREVEALGSTEKAEIIKAPKERKASTKKFIFFFLSKERILSKYY